MLSSFIATMTGSICSPRSGRLYIDSATTECVGLSSSHRKAMASRSTLVCLANFGTPSKLEGLYDC